MPPPKGKPVRQSEWFDANLQHDLVTSQLAMGTFHMVQNTVAGYSSKRQSTVETATYATEFIAGQTCLDEAIALRYKLRMLGAPLEGPIWMFGDNKSMIKSSAEPSGRLAKRHLILSLTDDSAPDGECQAGFSIGLEQAVLANNEAVPVFDDSWHPVFYNDQWYLMPLEAYHTWIVMPEGICPWINTNDVHVDGHVG
jgi:hypothetical protein